MRPAWAVLLLLGMVIPVHANDNWPGFRGAGKAVSPAKTLPDTWDTTKNVVWKVDVPGRGWSCPVVWGDRVYLTAVASEQPPQNPRKGLYIEDLNGKVPPGDHRWLVLCLDFRTGKQLWEREVHRGKPTTPVHIKNNYASSTPVTDGQHIWAYFGNVGVFCLDREGKLAWSRKVEPRKMEGNWGPASSLAHHRDRIFLLNDNEEASYLEALDARTGKQLWKADRPEKSSWTTPFVWHNSERVEVVTVGKEKIRSHDLDGKQLWELSGLSMLSIPTPFAHDGLLYVTSGYVLDIRRRPLYAIKPGATGDISLKQGETSNRFIAWSQRFAGPYHPTPVTDGELIYVLLDRGFLSCYEAKTGKQVYDRKRLPGGSFTASPWVYDGKVFCLSEDGETFVVKAGRDFEVLGRNRLDEMTLASPAIANGSLLLRTMSKLYRLEKK